MKKFIAAIITHRFVIVYCILAVLFLLMLNNWLWPTPDEYLYGLLSLTLHAGWEKTIDWSNINTEHVGALSALSAIYNTFAHPETLSESRIFVIGFAIGTILLLYGISRSCIREKRYWSWLLWLLLLVPGFWVFSVRLMLDIPATFSVALILYFLLREKPTLYVSVALALLLLFREYYVYLLIPLLVLFYAIDTFRSPGPWLQRIGLYILRLVIVFTPTLLIIFLLVDFNLLPYARLLENSLNSIFGDVFRWINKTFLLTSNWLVHLVDPSLQLASDTAVTSTPAPIPTSTFSSEGSGLSESIEKISSTSRAPTGVVAPQIVDAPIIATTFVEKLWLIYYYNFSEADINIFMLPLFVIGLWIRGKTVIQEWRTQYSTIRADIIFFILIAVFAYFNYHEAENSHGLRVVMPVIFAILYFAYFGARALLEQPSKWVQLSFSALVISSVALYWFTLQQVIYGSVLSQAGWLQVVFSLKPYLFIIFFILIAAFILWYPRWRLRSKAGVLACLLMFLFVIKFTPFYLDNKVSTELYGYDYGLPHASPLLQRLSLEGVIMCGNINNYTLQYYARDPEITNFGSYPKVRSFSKYYPPLYRNCELKEELPMKLQQQRIVYVLIVNDDYNEEDLKAWKNIKALYPASFQLIQARYRSTRLQWALYRFLQVPS